MLPAHAPILRPFTIAVLTCCLLANLLTSRLLSQTKPDVLFIAVDDLNDWTGHLGGHPQAKTPNIDRLVARGVTFTNAHCAAPACNPSRAALMSGLRPWQTGIYVNPDPADLALNDTITLNQHLVASGYRTLAGGKIYHGKGSSAQNRHWSQQPRKFASTGANRTNLNGLKKSHFDWGPLDNRPSDMGDYKLTDWAIEQLRDAPTDRPLFLAVGYVKPHLPWYVPQEYFDRFPLDKIQLPLTTQSDLDDIPPAGLKMAKPTGDHAAVLKGEEWEKAVQAYLATVSFLDDQVGRLLEALESSPRADNTIVVWWTDHGWHLGEKQHWRKFALWEDATRTSFAIAAPGITQPNQQCDAPVDYTSVYPTLCDLLDIAPPVELPGKSLVPLLRKPDAAWAYPAICTHGRGNHAVVSGPYRLIRYADGAEELYDHRTDPREWHNLAQGNKQQSVRKQLAALLPPVTAEQESTLSRSRKRKP